MSGQSRVRRVARALRAAWRGSRLRLLIGDPQWHPLPAASLDDPADGSSVSRDFVRVRGWAMSEAGLADRVELTVDGAPAAVARLCAPRPDLVPAFGKEHAMLGGFEHALDLTGLPPGTDSIVLGGVAHLPDGSSLALKPAHIRIEDPELASYDEERAALLRSRTPVAPAAEPIAGERPPHVLVVTHDLNLGGGQLVLLELLERFAAERGMTGAVVAPRRGATLKRLEAAGFPVHVMGELPLDDVEAYEGRLAELVAWAAPQGFDAVLVNTMVAFAGGDVAERLGLPAVWIVHESYGLDGFWATFPEEWLHPHMRQRGVATFGDAAAVIFEADATRRLFEADAAPGACRTIPYGIDVPALGVWGHEWDRARARRELELDPEDVVIACIGTIEPRKGQTQLVEAFARVAAAHPRARLALVGSREDGHERAPQIAIEAHGLENRVDIVPVRPDVRPWYAAADLLVCASDVESLPRTVLEAMALRLPVLATDVFGLPEVIRDGETGWLCTQRDTAALTDGLARALSTPPAERKAIADAAWELIAREHDSATCAARYADVIEAAARRASAVATDRD
ncbi:MAG: glycosyltransferase family 4 protein [Conexibacter sp.]